VFFFFLSLVREPGVVPLAGERGLASRGEPSTGEKFRVLGSKVRRIRSSPRIPGRTEAIAEFSRSSPGEPAGFRLTRTWPVACGVAELGVGVPRVGSVKFALVPECLVEPRQ